MQEKTFYELLGVREDADPRIIRAAYRTMAQAFHPDRYDGNKDEANKKMSELNVAYEVLSDPERRANYDNKLNRKSKDHPSSESGKQQASSEKNTQKKPSKTDSDPWEIARQAYPEIERIYRELMTINGGLGDEFRSVLIRETAYHRADDVAIRMRDEFLSKYYGDDEDIKKFALEVIRLGNKSMAKYLNEVVVALGNSASIDVIHKLFSEKYPHHAKRVRRETLAPHLLDRIKKGLLTLDEAIYLTKSLGGKVYEDHDGLYVASLNGTDEKGMSAKYFRSRFLQSALLK